MRLTAAEQATIRELTRQCIGADATVRLFGSRLDDSRRGGDIDLLVESGHEVAERVLTACRLAARLERALDGRRVDVVLVDPSVAEAPVHAIARREGRLL